MPELLSNREAGPACLFLSTPRPVPGRGRGWRQVCPGRLCQPPALGTETVRCSSRKSPWPERWTLNLLKPRTPAPPAPGCITGNQTVWAVFSTHPRHRQDSD